MKKCLEHSCDTAICGCDSRPPLPELIERLKEVATLPDVGTYIPPGTVIVKKSSILTLISALEEKEREVHNDLIALATWRDTAVRRNDQVKELLATIKQMKEREGKMREALSGTVARLRVHRDSYYSGEEANWNSLDEDALQSAASLLASTTVKVPESGIQP